MHERPIDRLTEPKTRRADETPVPRSPRPIIQDGGRIHSDLKVQSWAVRQVLKKEVNRRSYVAKSVIYRFHVEQDGS